jgi:hypothetical protein
VHRSYLKTSQDFNAADPQTSRPQASQASKLAPQASKPQWETVQGIRPFSKRLQAVEGASRFKASLSRVTGPQDFKLEDLKIHQDSLALTLIQCLFKTPQDSRLQDVPSRLSTSRFQALLKMSTLCDLKKPQCPDTPQRPTPQELMTHQDSSILHIPLKRPRCESPLQATSIHPQNPVARLNTSRARDASILLNASSPPQTNSRPLKTRQLQAAARLQTPQDFKTPQGLKTRQSFNSNFETQLNAAAHQEASSCTKFSRLKTPKTRAEFKNRLKSQAQSPAFKKSDLKSQNL